MSVPTPPPAFSTMAMPLGFAAQMKALQETQREQNERIADLERENAALRAFRGANTDLLARIEALEQHNANLTARRKEAVSQLFNLRTCHQEANNAFNLRAMDIQPDDLEGMLAVYGSAMTSVLNHHQRALGQLSHGGYYRTGSAPTGYAYPRAYYQTGYCRAHSIPYPCHVCDR